MEEKKNINVTRHAIMRYAARVYSGQIITERTFDIWRNNNEEKVIEIEKLIKEEYGVSDYITTASYDKHRKAEFYVNEEKMMTYIVADNNIVTCYKIDFELDERGNLEIYLGFKNALKRALEEEENWEVTSGAKIALSKNEIKLKNSEIEELETKLNRLRAEKKMLEAEQEHLLATSRELKAKIYSIREKLVRSKLAI
ncbi:hypothetical protein [Fusobacterium sp. THCT1E2]